MQAKLAHRDESAWMKGDLAYDLNDTMEIGVAKAAQHGIRPGSNSYAAFITAFARRVRSKEVASEKRAAVSHDANPGGSAVVLDFSRAAS
jgi:hypothetical protein